MEQERLVRLVHRGIEGQITGLLDAGGGRR